MYNHILIATDGSEFAENCIDHGLDLAKALGCKVTVITVTTPYSISGLPGGWLDNATMIEQYEKEQKSQADKILAAASVKAEQYGVTISAIHLANASAASAIMHTADQQDVDLIVMSSHGRTGLKRLLLGSQTNEVITLSRKPVLIVR